ncbi:MAG: EamA family transporter [Saprospiraceae bacterium]|nr:EamA family transporter [Saprospiraceae bacterium]
MNLLSWQVAAYLSMIFAGLTAVIAKAGLKNVSGTTGLAVRTIFVTIFIGAVVLLINRLDDIHKLTKKDVFLLGVSGLTTALSWLFYYHAIKIGNVSQVALIDKGSIVITLILAILFLNEPVSPKLILGGVLVIAGLIVLTLK